MVKADEERHRAHSRRAAVRGLRSEGSARRMVRERYQAALAQLSQGPVDMNGAEPQGIGERVLVERTVEAGRCRLNGAVPADVHEVLNRHRLVARSRPQGDAAVWNLYGRN